MIDLDKEFNYYLQHQDKLAEKYNGKILVIKNQEVIGTYSFMIEAMNETLKDHKIGTFLVQKCGPEEENYTAKFHSRVY